MYVHHGLSELLSFCFCFFIFVFVFFLFVCFFFNYHRSVNYDRPGECNPEKDCL